MGTLLFLSHRFPFPPDRGEKIRAWNLIQHLAGNNRIIVGCLVDDERDWQHRPALDAVCAETGCFAIDKRWQKLRALARIRPGRPLMLDYYDSPALHRWVAEVTARETIDAVYIFSTAMAPYAEPVAAPLRILDMVDVDSEKWIDYAKTARWPASLVWAREGRTLLAYERKAAQAFDHTLLVTAAECSRFAELAPETRGCVDVLENGVDLAFFAPDRVPPFANPYPATASGPWIALVGNMDYWPNADAAQWFAHEMLPALRLRDPPPNLAIVGAQPGPAVRALAKLPGVLVTGRVDDVRPYLAHAAAVIAPLRIARGVQNKVLEGMAMGRPTIASPQAFEGIRVESGRDLLIADGAAAMVQAVAAVLDGQYPELGEAGRRAVTRHYAWPVQLTRLDAIMARP